MFLLYILFTVCVIFTFFFFWKWNLISLILCALLQGVFTTQESNAGLPHCRWILYCVSRQESPWILEWVAYPFSRGSSQPRNQTRFACIAGKFFAILVGSVLHWRWFLIWNLTGGSSSKEPTCQCRRHERREFDSCVRNIP